uniref:Holin n=1 Tax=viral metagenome TaxID=1070528 RepID=A0A6H2A3B3_9ZZZZ
MNTKSWLKSKTVWLNIIGAIIAIVQAAQGQAWMSPEWQVFILAVLNALVRLLTNTAIVGTPGAK